MSIGIKNLTLALLAIEVCLLVGCGGAGNTVEMPTNPAPPPKMGPAGATMDGEGASSTPESDPAMPSMTAPPAANP